MSNFRGLEELGIPRPSFIKGQFSLRFPKFITKLPQFWQPRFYDFNVYSHKKKNEKLEYMHANPVVRGLVEHPKDWPWSSFSFLCKRGSRIGRDRSHQYVVMENRKKSKKKPHPQKTEGGGTQIHLELYVRATGPDAVPGQQCFQIDKGICY